MATDAESSYLDMYDPRLTDLILGEAAHLLRNLGFAAAHTVLIGGVVPSLLVLDPASGVRHVGTSDLDLCLSMAIVEGETTEYDRIETALRRAGYHPTELSFRWRQTERLRLEVEFFCPAGPDRPNGKMFRPKSNENPVAKHNFGPRLTAIALEAGHIIGQDVVVVEKEVSLPNNGGVTRFPFKVTGILGFLAAKIGALTGRDKPKDAYDIVWIIENWPGGPIAAAKAIIDSGLHEHPEAAGVLARLFDEFSTIERLGPRSYTRFMTRSDTSKEEQIRWTRQAVGAINEFGQELRSVVVSSP